MQTTRIPPSRKAEPTFVAAAVAAVLLASSTAASAQGLGARGGFGGGEEDVAFAQAYVGIDRSDNLSQRSGGGSGNLTTVGLRANVAHDGRRLDYGLAGDLSRVDYSNTYDATSQGALSGYALWGGVDDVLNWRVLDSVTQSRVNAFAAATPDNREYVNSFSTGPSLNFRFGTSGFFRVDGLYTRQSYEDSPLDANTWMGSASVGRLIGTGGSLSLQAALGRTGYADNRFSLYDYDLREYFVSYRSGERARTSLTADLGYTEVKGDRTSSSDPLVRLELRRRPTERMSVFLRGEQRYGSSANSMLLGGGQGLLGPGLGGVGSVPRVGEFDTALSLAGAVRTRSVDAGWSLTGRRTTLSLLAGRADERYDTTLSLANVTLPFGALTRDRKVTRVQGIVDRHLRSTLDAQLSAEYRKENLAGNLPTLDTQEYRFALNQRLGRRLGVSLNVAYLDRSDNGSIYDFSEMRYGLRLNYLLTRPGAGE